MDSKELDAEYLVHVIANSGLDLDEIREAIATYRELKRMRTPSYSSVDRADDFRRKKNSKGIN